MGEFGLSTRLPVSGDGVAPISFTKLTF